MQSPSSNRAVVRWCPPWLIALLMVTAMLAVAPTPVHGDVEAGAASSPAGGTSSGDEFWLAFPHNAAPDVTLELFLAGSQAGSGTVSVPGLGFSEDFTVTPGQVETVEVPLAAMLTGSDEVGDLGVHVVADTDISAYGLNQAPFSTDAYLGLPVDVLGTEHFVLTSAVSEGRATQFAVVATQDDTTVTITPSETVGGRSEDEPYDVVLDAGQTYQLQTTGAGHDLSGSLLESDKPVAAFGAHEGANVPPGVTFADHIVQQLFPTSSWGSSFVTVPFMDRAGDTFRILASVDGTAVAIDGDHVATLDRGEFHEVVLDESVHLTSSEPVSVSQYMHGSSYDAGKLGDPSVVPVAPAEQFLAEYTVTTPAEGFADHAINLVVPDPAVGEVAIDGDEIPAGEYEPIGNSGYSGVQVAVEPGSKVLDGPMPFAATMYGTNEDDSYAYPGGLSLSPVGLVESVTIELDSATSEIDSEACVPATVLAEGGAPLSGIRVDFQVTGVNEASGFVFTGEDGRASFCYTSSEVGDDTITGTVGPHSDSATLTWEDPPPPPDPDALKQSFWIYGPLYAFDEDGEKEDVLEDLIESLADDLGDPVELFDDLDFRETPSLEPQLVSDTGQVRDDVDVRAGVLTTPQAPGGGAVMVVATPRAGGGVGTSGGRHVIRSGDSVRLNLSSLSPRVSPGTTIGSAPAFGETHPAPGEAAPTEDPDPIAMMEERFSEDPESGGIQATVASVTDENTGQPVVAAVPGGLGTVSEGPTEGSLEFDTPAIDRMIDHFQNASIGKEVGISAAMAFYPTPAGILTSVFGLISTGFVLYDAMEEFSSILGGIGTEGFQPPRGAGSHGDPHHRTHDGVSYNFMAVGEFVATRTDGLEVQIRTRPVRAGSDVSLNEVVAVGIGDDVLVVTGGIDGPILLNDEEIELSAGEEVIELDTGTIEYATSRVRVTTDDGHVVNMNCRPCDFVDVFVDAADPADGSWEGLLGTHDGDASNELQARDGTVFDLPLSFEQIHEDLAEEWRVTQDESLFVYGPGEDTETFTDRSFPEAEVTVESLPEEDRRFAEAVCSDAGLGDHDPFTFEACVLDFAVTGSLCFVSSAQQLGLDYDIGTADDSNLIDEDDPDDPDDPDEPDEPDEPGVPDDDPPRVACPPSPFSDVASTHPHFEGICRTADEDIARGFRDGTFGPGLDVSREQLASFVARALRAAGHELPPVIDHGFTDLDRSVHADAINRLVAAGIVEGVVRHERFDPRSPVTRDQTASFLVRAVEWARVEELSPAGGPYFPDTGGSVHEDNIDIAQELGLTSGTLAGTFEPRKATTRGQTATFLSRLLDVVGEDAD